VQRLPNLEVLRVPGLLIGGHLGDADVVNIGHARRIARRSGAPILLHVETWLDSTVMQSRAAPAGGGIPVS
jgi:hypothetical protein